jgi:hypothetical protein|nr:hypothetical protein [Rhodoferax sp.]
MKNSKQSKLSQAAIGRALGISPASMTKCKGMGMPVHSLEAARTWREHNIAPTMHKLSMQDATTSQRHKPMKPSGAVPHMLALQDIAAAALEAGQTITPMVPALRAAMHAVPEHERDPQMLVQVEVMDVLTADVAAAMAQIDDAGDGPSPGVPMTDDELDEMGLFWYQVAAGEIVLA